LARDNEASFGEHLEYQVPVARVHGSI
jgi:hypothetical protein